MVHSSPSRPGRSHRAIGAAIAGLLILSAAVPVAAREADGEGSERATTTANPQTTRDVTIDFPNGDTLQVATSLDLLTARGMRFRADLALIANTLEYRRRALAAGVNPDRLQPAGTNTAAPWELKAFSRCGSSINAGRRARIELVNAWELMCRDAAHQGVRLVLGSPSSAYRTPSYQLQLFRRAVARYGSEAAAAKWTAWSDGRHCLSRHCFGAAVDVTNTGGAWSWMNRVVGCLDPNAMTYRSAPSCRTGERAVARVQLYGFARPMSYEPWHMELDIPLVDYRMTASGRSDSCFPRGMTAPALVASIFRCRLQRAGVPKAVRERLAAEAVVVARCASAFNPVHLIHDGRYLDRPDPVTGRLRNEAGLFGLDALTATRWVLGGYRVARRPQTNAHAAVGRLMANRELGRDPWSGFACSNDRTARAEIDRNPSLPPWAWLY